MIDFIHGVLRDKTEGYVVVEAGGIGYRVNILPTDSSLVIGEYVKLYTHYIHKEDLVELYGFYDLKSREIFRHLISVSGIGARIGMRILSDLGFEDVINAVISNDFSILTRVNGLGKKGANRVILELEAKFKKSYSGISFSRGGMDSSVDRTAVEALMALGYTEGNSIEVVSLVLKGGGFLSTEDIIKGALKLLVKV